VAALQGGVPSRGLPPRPQETSKVQVEARRRILVSSSGTHSVRSDRVAPDSLRIFRG
jgi:hypothetical protein